MKKNDAPADKSTESAPKEFVEIDQHDSALAVNGLAEKVETRTVVINQAAARFAREDFLHAVHKCVPDFFAGDAGKQNQKQILALAE